jgi:hypothetical protein
MRDLLRDAAAADGIWLATPSRATRVRPIWSCIGVATGPGLTAFTRMPRPDQLARQCVRASETNPAFSE